VALTPLVNDIADVLLRLHLLSYSPFRVLIRLARCLGGHR